MPDNKQIKDGLGNLFTVRMRDLSAALDGSVQQSWVQSTLMPIDYGGGGSFQHCAKSAAIPAGIAANSPIYAFQYVGGLLAVVRRVRISAWALAVPFTAGVATFDLYIARAFTAQYGGGTIASLAGDAAQMRTVMRPSQADITYSTSVVLTAGTRVLDPDPAESKTVAVPAAANAPFGSGAIVLLDKSQGDHPLVCNQYEGFVVRATVPATGAWSFSVTAEWDEVPAF